MASEETPLLRKRRDESPSTDLESRRSKAEQEHSGEASEPTPSKAVSAPESPGKDQEGQGSSAGSCCVKFSNIIFYALCVITGQLFIKWNCGTKKKNGKPLGKKATAERLCLWFSGGLSYPFTILMLLANLGSLGFNGYIVFFCPYYHCGYFYTGEVHNESNNFTQDDHSINVSASEMEKYSNWNKVVISTATLAGFTSYILIIFMVMLPLYMPICWRGQKSSKSSSILSPFCDDNSDSSTKLKLEQTCYFHSFYFFNLFLYFSNLIVFGLIMKRRVSHAKRTPCDLDETGLILQFLSQLCAVQSCFIFSKVAYSSVNNYLKILKKFVSIDQDKEELKRLVESNDPTIADYFKGQGDSLKKKQKRGDSNEQQDTLVQVLVKDQDPASFDQARLYLLQNIYQQQVGSIQASLKPYGRWFSVHWIFYTLTAFLSLAFLTDTIDLYLYNTDKWYKDDRNIWSLTYISLFTIEHAFLFLYPCFRAAKISSVQNELISRFAAQQWRYIKPPVQAQFLSYLRSQNFGFQISLFCADITFGFNLAFVSIFIGTFGVVLKLSL